MKMNDYLIILIPMYKKHKLIKEFRTIINAHRKLLNSFLVSLSFLPLYGTFNLSLFMTHADN